MLEGNLQTSEYHSYIDQANLPTIISVVTFSLSALPAFSSLSRARRVLLLFTPATCIEFSRQSTLPSSGGHLNGSGPGKGR